MAIEKQLFERQLELIFRMLLENKTNEQMASELKISVRSIQNYKRRLEQRYMAYQKEKSNSTIFLEINLLKNRLLKLYRSLENKVMDPKTSSSDCAKCADVAAGIATNIIKLESEGIRAAKELGGLSATVNKNGSLNNLRNSNNDDDYDNGPDNNSRHHHHNQQQHYQEQEEDDNRKF